MKRKLSATGILLLFSCMFLFAQEWSKEDSLWLRNVLEGKETFKINEETKKAIEEGRLIVPSWIKNSDTDSDMELIKDFDAAGMPDSTRIPTLDIYSMPPAVYALYVLYMDKMDSAYQAKSLVITDEERKELEALAPAGAKLFYPYTSNHTPGVSAGGLDFNQMLSMIFSAQYRRIAHNRKYATAYKNYYDEGGINRPIRISEHERKQLMKSVNNTRPSIKVNTGNKFSGIDD